MKTSSETIIQIPFISKSKSKDKRIEFHKHKIIPQKESIVQRNTFREDEWQQEYYIIYNSYVLDEKDSES